MAHQINKAFCEFVGDTSQPEWEDAPQWQRDSAVNGVEYHKKNRNCTPAETHANWLAMKEKEGWVYGPVKDVDKKEHPCMLPYEQLPVFQQMKDLLFTAAIKVGETVIKNEGK